MEQHNSQKIIRIYNNNDISHNQLSFSDTIVADLYPQIFFSETLMPADPKKAIEQSHRLMLINKSCYNFLIHYGRPELLKRFRGPYKYTDKELYADYNFSWLKTVVSNGERLCELINKGDLSTYNWDAIATDDITKIVNYTWWKKSLYHKSLTTRNPEGAYSLLSYAIMQEQYDIAQQLCDLGAQADQCRIALDRINTRFSGLTEAGLLIAKCHEMHLKKYFFKIGCPKMSWAHISNYCTEHNEWQSEHIEHFIKKYDLEVVTYKDKNAIRSKKLFLLLNRLLKNGSNLALVTMNKEALSQKYNGLKLYQNNTSLLLDSSDSTVQKSLDIAQLFSNQLPPEAVLDELENILLERKDNDFCSIYSYNGEPLLNYYIDSMADTPESNAVVSFIIDKLRFDPDVLDKNRHNNALHVAAKHRCCNTPSTLALLLDPARANRPNVNQRNYLGQTPLHVAAQKLLNENIIMLIQAGADPSIIANDGSVLDVILQAYPHKNREKICKTAQIFLEQVENRYGYELAQQLVHRSNRLQFSVKHANAELENLFKKYEGM